MAVQHILGIAMRKIQIFHLNTFRCKNLVLKPILLVLLTEESWFSMREYQRDIEKNAN